MKVCFKCGTIVELEKVGRRDECTGCGNDLRVCLNCAFYNAARANACTEPQVEPVKEKDKANYCDFFRFREEATVPAGATAKRVVGGPVMEQKKSPKAEAEKLWNDLFKKR